MVDAIHGAPDLLAFGAEAAALAQLEALSQQAAVAERRRGPAPPARATLIVQLCQAVAVAAVLAVSVVAVHDHSIGRVMVAVLPLAALGAFEPVAGVAQAVARAIGVEAAAGRLLALDQVALPVADPAQPAALAAGVPAVAFEAASLRYHPDLPLALDGVSLELAPGARLAVTGSSGAGKSSLVSALLRFWPLEPRATCAWAGSMSTGWPRPMCAPPAPWSTRAPTSLPGPCGPT